MDWSKIKHFSRSEFACKCGCDEALMDEGFVQKLDQMREYLDAPIEITSGYRCPDHNDNVSSTGRTGPHTTGKAADIQLPTRELMRHAMTTACLRFNGVGINMKGADSGRFIHVDSLNFRGWTY